MNFVSNVILLEISSPCVIVNQHYSYYDNSVLIVNNTGLFFETGLFENLLINFGVKIEVEKLSHVRLEFYLQKELTNYTLKKINYNISKLGNNFFKEEFVKCVEELEKVYLRCPQE